MIDEKWGIEPLNDHACCKKIGVDVCMTWILALLGWFMVRIDSY